jgi:hypothetical protein
MHQYPAMDATRDRHSGFHRARMAVAFFSAMALRGVRTRYRVIGFRLFFKKALFWVIDRKIGQPESKTSGKPKERRH